MFSRISLFLKLTETELKVLLFLTTTLVIGFGYKTFFISGVDKNERFFDYREQDSLFFSLENDVNTEYYANESGKSVDYKQEVLDFNTRNFKESTPKVVLKENSINLNKAELADLILLPGIGNATAEKIIALRGTRGGFKRVDELLDVKGIGETKLYNIKKYLFIE